MIAVKVTVADGVQVAHDGTVYRPGDTADVPDHVAAQWITSGWVTEMQTQPSRRSTQGRRAEAVSKAFGNKPDS